MQGKVEICGVNTARLRVLSQTEMDALLRRSRDGDLTAREMLKTQSRAVFTPQISTFPCMHAS